MIKYILMCVKAFFFSEDIDIYGEFNYYRRCVYYLFMFIS